MRRIPMAVVALLLAGAAHANPELYAKKCASCHGKDGNPPATGKKMGIEAPVTATKLSEAEVVAIISGGRKKMPAYKDKLTEEEIASLARFVKGGLKE